MARPYRPSNGTEGEIFHEQFCYRCAKYGDPDEGDIPPCEIQGWALACDIGDYHYPKEWIEDEKGPRCTAFTLEPPPKPDPFWGAPFDPEGAVGDLFK